LVLVIRLRTAYSIYTIHPKPMRELKLSKIIKTTNHNLRTNDIGYWIFCASFLLVYAAQSCVKSYTKFEINNQLRLSQIYNTLYGNVLKSIFWHFPSLAVIMTNHTNWWLTIYIAAIIILQQDATHSVMCFEYPHIGMKYSYHIFHNKCQLNILCSFLYQNSFLLLLLLLLLLSFMSKNKTSFY
jgi:hypothetical protein